MSKEFDQQFSDWCAWYVNNVRRIPIVDPRRQWDFTTKALAGLIELLNQARHDIAVLEQRQRGILVPMSVEVRGDLRKFG